MVKGVVKKGPSKNNDSSLFLSSRKDKSEPRGTEALFPDAIAIPRRAIITPQYLPQIESHSAEDAARRSIISKTNTGEFFVRIYQSLEGGRVTPIKNRDIEYLVNGERRQFRPDIVHRKVRGMGFTEVKVTSTRAAQEKCSATQLRNYGFKLFSRINAGDELPWVDYAFFRYGDRNVNGLLQLENGNLTEKLAEESRDLLIAPLPLAFFMLMNSPEIMHDQTSSSYSVDFRSYWYVRSGMLNLFHKHGEGAIGTMLQGGARTGQFTPEQLSLDKITARHYRSPDRYTPHGTLLNPFVITKMRMGEGDYKKWLKFFAKHHEELLEDLGIADKYVAEEEQQTPF
jgi:hypothetical protein